MLRCRSTYAFDLKSSVREKLPSGALRVGKSNLTKHQVSPYLGREVQGSDSMGWDAEKPYNIYRPGDELEKAVPHYNELPLTLGHCDVGPEGPPKDKIMGTVGSRAAYDGGYITNSLTVWDANAVDAIENGDASELSCGYTYDLDPTPGEHEGQAYDAVMRNIRPDHVALVKAGRAGSEVRVADSAEALDGDKTGHALHGNQYLGGLGAGAKPAGSQAVPAAKAKKQEKPTEERESAMQDIAKRKGVSPKGGAKKYGAVAFADPVNKKYPLNTPKHVRAALSYWGMPKNRSKYSKADQAEIGGRIRAAAKRLGIGQTAGDSGSLKEEQMKNNLLAHRVAGATHAHLRTQLAADAAINGKDLLALVANVSAKKFAKQADALAGAIKDKYKLADAAPLRAIFKDMAEECADEDGEEAAGADEDDDMEDAADPAAAEEESEKEDKMSDADKDMKAADKAKKGMDAAIRAAVEIARSEARSLRDAEKAVEPLVGAVSFDTAEDTYRYALKQKGVDAKDVHPSALPALVKMLTEKTTATVAAADAASADNIATFERFPGLKAVNRIG